MPVFKKKNTMRKTLSSPVMVVAILIGFVLLARAGWSINQKAEASKEKKDNIYNELSVLEEKKEALAIRADFLRTDEGVESEIRQKYRLVKEGESIAVIVDEDSTDPESRGGGEDVGDEGDDEATTTRSWLQSVIDFFKVE